MRWSKSGIAVLDRGESRRIAANRGESPFAEVGFVREKSVRLAKELRVGTRLAMRGPLATLALVVAALTLLVALGVVFIVSRVETNAPVELFPHLVAQILAFGSGLPLVLAGALEAYSKDRKDGVRHLLRESGFDRAAYFRARSLGLFAALFGVVGGGTVIAGVLSLMFARRPHFFVQALAATGGAVLFAFSFALLISSVALATLAPRGKRAGYIAFLATFLGLEAIGPWLTLWLPLDFSQIISVKIALEKIRTGVLPGHDFGEGLRAFLLIGTISLLALLFARRELARVDGKEAT